ncbi:hypothetical protein OG563_00280 [Nocardia vinacea]|uniref:DUF222 domain-containing protein n=1 Tax=Nocardia vinacea TaxID=96468 RepID=A0ABZ1YX41_9NOCA|nr:hypothetical protein [Nocardia vinacea]
MTGPNSLLRIRDIPTEQAALLRQIHQLAAVGERLRQALSETSPDSGQGTELLDHIAEVDRERDLTEIRVRADGMPAGWVDQAREAGRTGRAWTDELLLLPTRSPARRRNLKRVVQDTRQLADMAAITVARQHRLATNAVTADPEPAAAEQLRRDMEALWTRAAATATSLSMDRTERARVFNAASRYLDRRVQTYRHYSLDDLNAAWRTYTTPTIAATVRRSLKSLRRTDRGTDTPATAAEQPPTSQALIDRARHSLDTAANNDSDTGLEIDSVITVAIPETTYRWDASAELDSGDSAAVDAYPNAGPDP